MKEITNFLFENADEKYREFNKKIVSDTVYPMIGIKVPVIRKLAKSIAEEESAQVFLSEKHTYYEECLLHGFIIAQEKKNVSKLLNEIDAFMPHIDSWATVDSVVSSSKAFIKDKNLVLKHVKKWLKSEKTYVIRFGIVTLLDYFIEPDYLEEILRLTLPVKTEEYYVNMAIAWLYSVMLVKHYDYTIKIFEENRIENTFVHNKSIQKAKESFRIPKEKKIYLNSLKRIDK